MVDLSSSFFVCLPGRVIMFQPDMFHRFIHYLTIDSPEIHSFCPVWFCDFSLFDGQWPNGNSWSERASNRSLRTNRWTFSPRQGGGTWWSFRWQQMFLVLGWPPSRIKLCSVLLYRWTMVTMVERSIAKLGITRWTMVCGCLRALHEPARHEKSGDTRGSMGIPGLVNIQKAIKNGYRNSGFSHQKWWIFP